MGVTARGLPTGDPGHFQAATFRLPLGPTASGWLESPQPQGPHSVPCHGGNLPRWLSQGPAAC